MKAFKKSMLLTLIFILLSSLFNTVSLADYLYTDNGMTDINDILSVYKTGSFERTMENIPFTYLANKRDDGKINFSISFKEAFQSYDKVKMTISEQFSDKYIIDEYIDTRIPIKFDNMEFFKQYDLSFYIPKTNIMVYGDFYFNYVRESETNDVTIECALIDYNAIKPEYFPALNDYIDLNKTGEMALYSSSSKNDSRESSENDIIYPSRINSNSLSSFIKVNYDMALKEKWFVFDVKSGGYANIDIYLPDYQEGYKISVYKKLQSTGELRLLLTKNVNNIIENMNFLCTTGNKYICIERNDNTKASEALMLFSNHEMYSSIELYRASPPVYGTPLSYVGVEELWNHDCAGLNPNYPITGCLFTNCLRSYHNCWAYAINLQKTSTGPTTNIAQYVNEYVNEFILPGNFDYSLGNGEFYYTSSNILINYMYNDMEADGNSNLIGPLYIKETTKTGTVSSGKYKIALFITAYSGNGIGFHFYRQNSDGYWSQKKGFSDYVTDKDNSGQIISDPYYCDKNYGILGGWYIVNVNT